MRWHVVNMKYGDVLKAILKGASFIREVSFLMLGTELESFLVGCHIALHYFIRLLDRFVNF